MRDNIEPLASSLWFRRVAMISEGHLLHVERSLRHAFHLLQLAPTRFRPILGVPVDEDRFESLLANGEYDSAARHLVAQPAALTVEQQEGQTSFRASIGCPVLKHAVQGTGESVAEAVLAAWTKCLLALESGESNVLSDHGHRDLPAQGRR
jgi:hypothetical protein